MKAKQKPMRNVWHSLLWKEWHEHKWKLAALMTTVAVLPLIFRDPDPEASLMFVSVTLLFYGILAGLFVGMGTAGGENHHGTMQFLQTLPISMKKPAAIKLLMSLFTVTVPVLTITGIGYAYFQSLELDAETLAEVVLRANTMGPFAGQGNSSLEGWLLVNSLAGTLFVSSLLLWMAAGGVNRSNEIHAGAIGFFVIVSFWGVLGIALDRAEKMNSDFLGRCILVPMATAPGGPAHLANFSVQSRVPLPVLALVAFFGHGLVLAWYLRRFGRKAVRPVRTLGGLASSLAGDQWLGPPRRSQLSAIIWKQVYETGPLAVMSAVAVVAMAGLAYWVQDRESPMSNEFGAILAAITMSVGYLVIIVAGMGVFIDDVKPKIGNFWRSRPINLPLWFAAKFITGLAVLAVTYGSLVFLAIWLERNEHGLPFDTEVLAIGASIFVLVYTVAMASYCISRHPVIAAMATIVVFFAGGYTAQFLAEEYLDPDPHWLLVVTMLTIAQFCATAVAWLAVRNNWGWQK